MTRTRLTSTTAIVLILHGIAPLPALAEREQAPDSLLEAVEGRGENATGANAAAAAAAEAARQQAEAEAAAAAKAAEEAAAQAKAAEEAARAEAERAAQQAQAEADAAAKAEAEAAAKAQADAEAAEDAARAAAEQAAAQAQIEAEAAARAAQEAAQAEADAAEAQAQADADATAQAEAKAAEEAAQAAADAAAEAQAEAKAAADAAAADAAAQAAADTAARQKAAQQAKEGNANALGDVLDGLGGTADAPTAADAQAQADQAQRAAQEAAQSAAAGADGQVVSTTEGTVTEADSRASDEEFSTTASGQTQTQAAPARKKDNDTLKTVGAIAAIGLGAYVVGRMLDDGGRVVSNTGDRAVIQDPNGEYRIIKDDDTLLRRPGSDVRTDTFSDGSTRTIVTAQDGSRTITVRAANGQVLRRARVLPDGREVTLFDDTRTYEAVDVSTLRPARRGDDQDYSTARVDDLRAALAASSGEALTDRAFSLNQIRRIDAVRHLAPVIALDDINFETGSAVIRPAEAQALSELGNAMRDAIDENPGQVFLIEGHTDTVGDARYNLALSDRRAESLALALSEYFDVPPANMVVQGYGESDLRIRREGDIRANRRGAVRNITPLLTGTDG